MSRHAVNMVFVLFEERVLPKPFPIIREKTRAHLTSGILVSCEVTAFFVELIGNGITPNTVSSTRLYDNL